MQSDELFDAPFNLRGEPLTSELDAEGEARVRALAESEARKAQSEFPGDWEPLDGSPAAREIAAHIAERARMAREQDRLFEAEHSPDHFDCGGTFDGFTCGSDADSGL